MKSCHLILATAIALTGLLAQAADEQKKTLQCEEITVFKMNNDMVDFSFNIFEINLTADSENEPFSGELERTDADGGSTSVFMQEDEDLKGLYEVFFRAGQNDKQPYDVSIQTLLKKSQLVTNNDLEEIMTGLTIPEGKKAQLYILTSPGSLYATPMVGMKTKYLNAVNAYNLKHGTNLLTGKNQPLHVAMSPLMVEGAANEFLQQFETNEVLIRGMNAFCIEKIAE